MTKLVVGVNDLETWCNKEENKEQGDRIKKEWTGICDDDRIYKMNEVARGSHKKALWRCSVCSYEWYGSIVHRTLNKRGCPKCGIEKAKENSRITLLNERLKLYDWCLQNGELGKTLLMEWTGFDEYGNEIKMSEVTYASNINMKWRCHKGHEWWTTIAHRTSKNFRRGCPKCNSSTSYPEQYFFHAFKELYPNTKNRFKVLKSKENPQGIEFDIDIADLRLRIEYSASYWHKGREEKGKFKREICKAENIRLIEIIEDNFNEYKVYERNVIHDNDCIYIDTLYSKDRDAVLNEVLDNILREYGHSIEEINTALVREKAIKYSKGIKEQKVKKYIPVGAFRL